MMELKTINEYFSRVNNNLIAIKNNSETGMYEFEIGLPPKWYMKSNDDIECEVITEIENAGTLYSIKPINEELEVSDVMDFIIKTIETNERIISMEESYEEKVKSYNKRLKSINEKLKKEAEEFYGKIEELKEQIFNNLDDDEVEDILEEINELSKEAKKREDLLNENITSMIDGNTIISSVDNETDELIEKEGDVEDEK